MHVYTVKLVQLLPPSQVEAVSKDGLNFILIQWKAEATVPYYSLDIR